MFWSGLFRPARPGYRTPYQRPHRTRQSKLGSLHPQAAKTAPRRLDSVPMPVRRTLLSRYPDNKVMLVESEKTALIRDAAANGTLPSNADIADWIISYRQSGNAMFQRNKSTISRHIRNVFESGELNQDSVVAFFATTAADGKNYNVAYYNLDVIISVGYRVNSHRGVQFRIWATQILGEYLVKGFAMNDDLLKRAGGGNYFDELLEGNVEPQEAYERACRQAPQGFIVPLETGPRK